MLVRFHYQELLNVLKEANCEVDMIEQFMEVLYKEVLHGLQVPIGIGMQISDILLEEVYKCFGTCDEFKIKQKEIEALLSPFLRTFAQT